MSAMTLEQVRERLQSLFEAGPEVSVRPYALAEWIEGVDAHLTAHAQMVDKVREVIEVLRSVQVNRHFPLAQQADKLAAAIGDAK